MDADIGERARPLASPLDRKLVEQFDQRRARPGERAVRLTGELEQAHFVELVDAMGHRTVPIDLIEHRPPDQAEHGHAFFAETLDVLDVLFQPDFAIDRLTFDAGFRSASLGCHTAASRRSRRCRDQPD